MNSMLFSLPRLSFRDEPVAQVTCRFKDKHQWPRGEMPQVVMENRKEITLHVCPG